MHYLLRAQIKSSHEDASAHDTPQISAFPQTWHNVGCGNEKIMAKIVGQNIYVIPST